MDTTVLLAILFNTFLLAVEGPANILAEDTLLMMVAADTVLTVGPSSAIPTVRSFSPRLAASLTLSMRCVRNGADRLYV